MVTALHRNGVAPSTGRAVPRVVRHLHAAKDMDAYMAFHHLGHVKLPLGSASSRIRS